MMALERVPADIRRDGGVARMTDPKVRTFDITCIVFNEMLEVFFLPLPF